MKEIKIIADSLCDISAEYAKKHAIEVLPLNIVFGEEQYQDGIDLSQREFYRKLKEEANMPKTAQVNPAEFQTVYDRYPDSIILYVGSSSKASGTYQSGVMAKEMSGREDIYTFDTMQLSMGSGLMVAEAQKMASQGQEIAEIFKRLEYMKKKMQTIFTVDTLEFLQRGGRISKTKAILGTMLSVKPILTVEEGLVAPMDSVRGKKKVNEKVRSLIRADRDNLKGETIAIVHADCYPEMRELRDQIMEDFLPDTVIESQIGAGIGTHCGPGTVAVFYLRK